MESEGFMIGTLGLKLSVCLNSTGVEEKVTH